MCFYFFSCSICYWNHWKNCNFYTALGTWFASRPQMWTIEQQQRYNIGAFWLVMLIVCYCVLLCLWKLGFLPLHAPSKYLCVDLIVNIQTGYNILINMSWKVAVFVSPMVSYSDNKLHPEQLLYLFYGSFILLLNLYW